MKRFALGAVACGLIAALVLAGCGDDDWHSALDLLDQSADKLDDAEAGDEEAQSEALFDLQAQAQEHIDTMNMPFTSCFVE